MNERTIIKERLRKKEQEIQNLEEKIRTARVYVQALHDVLKVLDKSSDESGTETVLKPGSTVSQARDVILKAGKPVHIDDLLVAMGKEVNRDTRASLTGSLAAYVRRGDIFTRAAPNTYGLAELGHDDAPEAEDQTPPKGFGMTSDEDEEIEF